MAVIVNGKLPSGVLPKVETAKPEVPDEVIVAGEKTAVAPVGNPVTLKDTVPVNPVVGVMVAP